MKKNIRLSSAHIVLAGFLLTVLLGSILLSMPFCSASGKPVPYIDALFTATTAVCVTGLVTLPVVTTWSTAGHVIILILIQIGGLGIITVVSGIMLAIKHSFRMRDSIIIRDAFNLNSLSGIKRFLKATITGVFAVEAIGAVLYMTVFVPEFGAYGIWVSVFNSVSAFCNAGFAVCGDVSSSGSLVMFQSDGMVLLTLSALVIIGGLGFLVWQDMVLTRRFQKMTVYTRMVLLATVTLLLVGTTVVAVTEWNNPNTLGPMSVGEKLLNSFFQSVTLRTAGFFSFDQAAMTDGTKAMCALLMLVGGGSGSTAGGIKMVTVMVLLLFLIARARGKNSVTVFKRTIPSSQVLDAMTITGIVAGLAVFGAIFISLTSPVNFINSLYESASAIATVGITAGATGVLSVAAQIMIIIFMYFGRVGILTISLGFLMGNQAQERFRYAETNLLIG